MVSANAVADLGVSLDYNIFVEQNLTSQNSQSNGRVAAGGNVTLNGYGVATVVSVPAQGAALLVGNDLSFSNGRVYHGGILAGGDVSGVNAAVVNGLVAGATIQGSAQLPFSFQTEFNNLRAISNTLSAAETNGQVEYLYGGVRISGDCSSNIQVFNIDAAQLKTSNHIVINCVPSGATVVFNVSGISNPSMMNMGNLVWNFHGATSLSFANVAVPGLILAPIANIDTTWGAISGTVIGKSWTGSFSLEHRPFTGNLLPLLQQAPTDSDNDGVPDATDVCPSTSLGETVNAVGCAPSQLDADADDVNDDLDQCPATPQGEVSNAEGCAPSQLDTDGDTINDAIDQCPETPEGEAPNSDGCAPTQLDSDTDGVNDALDQCPATPQGEAVNEQGCAPSQLDADGDGVNDSIDQCPATPQSETPNAQGCSLTQLDGDNDGVNDALDQCPATPQGETPNAEGCAPSQLDADNDGASDAVDICPNTPNGEAVNAQGCSLSQLDTDNDGVSDALDQCPATPVGETPNEQGCALTQLDSDNDGANDAVDQCPATPVGEQANAEGCAPSQLDTDNDGVNDAIDQCPATPEGEQANADGCALTQLDSDNDGVNDAIDQCPSTPEDEQANTEGCAPSQLDTDNDTVNDAIDQCPATPEGEQANAEGCALSQLDTDNDTVNDADDQCPATPAGEQANAEGCAPSQLDTDNDGINDAIDQCLSTPIGEQVNSEGCALSQLDTDNDGVNDAVDQCAVTPVGDTPNAEGCSPDQIDTDNDGTPDYLDAFPNDPNEATDLDGDGIGDNADTDRDGDGVLNENDSFPNDPTESQDTDGDGIGDNADPDLDGDGVNNEDDYFPTDPDASSVPAVQISSPGTLITVGSSPIRITGTVDDLNATLIINGVEIAQNNGSFEADVAIEEGANNIIVRAIDERNNEGTATITVSLDKTPPYITVQSPEKGGKVFTDSISVSGLVNDIVRGTVSADEANVQVSSSLGNVTASVSNRSYLAENVQLQVGENQITITAQDAVGNQSADTFTVTYEPQQEKVIELVSGNAQSAEIQTNVAEPLTVKLTENGQPVIDKTVVFRVTEGDGLLQPGTDSEGNGAVVATNAQGIAQVNYKLGSRAGTGNHKVMARAVGFKGEVQFYQSANYGDGIQMGVIAGNNQRGSVRQPLAQPLVLAVTDAGANLIPNVEIGFEVTSGSGVFSNGENAFTTTTDMDGRASAIFSLGAEEGLDEQRVTARLTGTNARVSFTLSGFVPGDPSQTKISGVVLNNQDTPMPSVTIRVDGSNRQAVTDQEGLFTIDQVPVGPVHLLVEGSTTSISGEWPSLSYNLVTVPGVDNPMASPIYLVEIDTDNAVFIGREDTVVTHPELPGFELDVKAGSVTFPDGSKEGMLSITRVNANKVPMPPPNGMQPQLIVTIQPHGAKFDPPARLTLPNTDGHSPLAEVEMYSFDHDLEEFVTIGLGTVSKDGSSIVSNVGVGVIKAGWHCGSGPGGNACGHDCTPCNDCNQQCVCEFADNDPRLDSECQACEKLADNKGRAIPANEGGSCSSQTNTNPRDCRGPGCKNGICDPFNAHVDETSALVNTPFDCKKPKCDQGAPKDDFDVGDIDPGDVQCKFCDINSISLRDKPNTPIFTPTALRTPSVIQVPWTGSWGGNRDNVASPGATPNVNMSCQSICVNGQERWRIEGDIQPNWDIYVSTNVVVPACATSTTARVMGNVARTTTHESDHTALLMPTLMTARMQLGSVHNTLAICRSEIANTTAQLTADFRAASGHNHGVFIGDTRYYADCDASNRAAEYACGTGPSPNLCINALGSNTY